MTLHFYPAVIERGDDNYGVVFPDLPGCTSAGWTQDDAARQAAEALTLHLNGMREDGEGLPPPSAVDAPLPQWLKDMGAAIIGRVLVPAEVADGTDADLRLNVMLPADLVRAMDRVSDDRSRFLTEAARAALA